MHDQALVGEAHGLADPQEEAQPRGQVQAALPAVTVDRQPLDVLHHQVGAAVGGAAAVQQAGDAGMLELRQDLALGAEAPHQLVGVEAALEELEGRLLAEVPLAGRQPDRAHAAPAQLAHELPRTHAGRLPRRSDQRVLEEGAGLPVGAQQRDDLAAQLRVALAQLLQGCLPGSRGQLAHGVEGGPDLLPALGVHGSLVQAGQPGLGRIVLANRKTTL